MLKIKKQQSQKAEEELHRLWEETDRELERERIPDQEHFTDEERQKGIAIHANELVRRITKMNPGIWAEDSINCPGNAGFYYTKPDGLKACAQTPFNKGMVREFTRVYVDMADRPVGIQYGWREILYRLLKLKLISWESIQSNFPIYDSVRSELFDAKVQELKN